MLSVPLGFAACYQRDARTKMYFGATKMYFGATKTHSGATKTHSGATKKSLTRVFRARVRGTFRLHRRQKFACDR